jgi:hypothetical protein
LRQNEIEEAAARFFDSLRGELRLPDALTERTSQRTPMLVKDLDGNPSYWLVPLAGKDRVVGFLRLSLAGELLAYGRFGQGRELHDFPPFAYLSEKTARKEIEKAFGSIYQEISPPQLVHDGPVDRITWLSLGRRGDKPPALLFWTFGSSYSRAEGEQPEYGLF